MDKKLKIVVLVFFGLFIAFLILPQLIKNDTIEQNVLDISTENNNAEVIQSRGNEDYLSTLAGHGKPVYKIFFENSGSMNGYVRGNTRIKNAISDLVHKINGYNLADSIELYWLNSKAEPRNGNLNSFITSLNPGAFQEHSRGNINETDMSKRFRIVLERIENNNVGIMISDCLLLPRIGEDETIMELLPRNRIEVYSHFTNKLREQNLNTLVLQVYSNYNGIYYDYQNPMNTSNNQRINNQDRPYFIWIFGKEQYLAEFISVLGNIEYIQEDLNNKHYFFIRNEGGINYRAFPNPRIGSYSLCRSNPHTCIENARPETRGNLNGFFQFPIAVDFSNLPLEKSYYEDPDNYIISENYTLSITRFDHDNFTHLLHMRTDNLRTELVEVKLINQIPKWVDDYNLYDDSDILDPEKINKTFGIKYLFNGVHEAYIMHSDVYYFEISISVNR